ncbi:E3 ubiquitin-protein ligase SINA-like 7 [Raphanus sativus]|uniref:RING-type E3 ubiquitin transferase n=1 Tax=Raphanus sativus TaxID=3726 RepID=A0A6J0N568_RAPSA|nr:E3 ubiquitin-protein ligase SINA-like 7 [Raphanus sativus]
MECVSSTEDKPRTGILNLDVLSCPICVEPFTIPIFQCDNGHLACSSCCPKLRNKCPSCALPVGHSRCRAMETVLESTSIPCQNAEFGCTQKLTYGEESTHEKTCTFSPCYCPVKDCNYTGSCEDVYLHYKKLIHQKPQSTSQRCRVRCGSSFFVKMNISDKLVIGTLYEKRLLFTVQSFWKPYGVYVTVSCIAPPSSPKVEKLSYCISYTMDGHTITYKSPELKMIQRVSFHKPEENYMWIPNSLVHGKSLETRICIKKREKDKSNDTEGPHQFVQKKVFVQKKKVLFRK